MRNLKKRLAVLLALLLLTALLPSAALAAETAAPGAVYSEQTVVVNGASFKADVYNIGGYNYFKLRDLASLMNGTSSQYSVDYDETARTVSVATGQPYAAVGGELERGTDRSATCTESAWKLLVNGVEPEVSVYNIGGNNYFKLRDLGVALGFVVDYDEQSRTAYVDEGGCSLIFDKDAYTLHEDQLPDGSTLKYRAYENLTYESNPVDARYQIMNIYVPALADEDTPIFIQNTSGGYNSGAPKTDADATVQAFLSRGYVVASCGLRGQNARQDNGDGTTTYTGRAPASVADLKAAIRYLRYNDAVLPGSADRMILGGSSSGGGTTAITGVTTDSPEYAPYLQAMGAADVSDALFACVCYCPVFNVDTSDLAYAWQVQDMDASIDNATSEVRSFINGGKLGLFHNARNGYEVDENGVYALNEREKELTAYFAGEFPAYMNDVLKEIGLADLSVNDDGRTGSFVDFLRDTVSAEYDRYMTANWSPEVIRAFIAGTGYREEFALTEANADKGTFDVDRSAWLSYDESGGTVSVTDLWAFFDYVGLLKSAPAFDGKRETNVYGEAVVANDVTGTVFDPWLAKYDGKEVSDAVLQQEHLYSVFDFLCDAETPNVPNWFIRYGTIDNGVHAYPALLAASLEAQGQNVDYRMAFERTHSGFYELDELFAWLDGLMS